MTDFTALIEKLEKAEEGSRELNAEIFWLIDNDNAQRVYWNAAFGMPRKIVGPMPKGLGRLAVECHAPAYTTSLDAALTLVPEGWVWSVHKYSGAPPACEGDVARDMHSLTTNAAGHTPALALCIAALKARSAA